MALPSPTWTLAKRFWQGYALAWLPYFAVVLLMLQRDQPRFALTLLEALRIVLPPALMGAGLIVGVTRFGYAPRNRLRCFGFQAGMVIAFAVLTFVVVRLLGGLSSWLTTGRWELRFLDAWAPVAVLTHALIFGTICVVLYGMFLNDRLRREQARAAQAELLRGKAELQALRAQLNPHFLFNTLHSLQALIRSRPTQAEEALDRFGDLLRYPLRIQSRMLDLVPLEEEWAFIQAYLELESLRFGERLTVHTQWDAEAFDVPVPVFCLQPVVENSIKYAVEPRVAGGRLTLTSRLDESCLVLSVVDDGPGCREEDWREAGGLGLSTLRRRWRAIYGEAAGFRIETAPGAGFAVFLTIPLQGNRSDLLGLSVEGEA